MRFTIVKNERQLSKTISYQNGVLVKSTECAMQEGEFYCRDIPSKDFINYLREARQGMNESKLNLALMFGINNKGIENGIYLSRARMNGHAINNAITRTDDNHLYPAEEAILPIDIDGRPGWKLDDYDAEICAAYPLLSNVQRHYFRSSSSGIMLNGMSVSPKAAYHLLIVVSNGSANREIANAIYKGLFEQHGEIVLSKSGSMLDRTIMDVAIYQPSRLIFMFGSKLTDGLTYNPEGDYELRGAQGFPRLTVDEQTPRLIDMDLWKKTDPKQQQLRLAKRPEADVKRAAFILERAAAHRTVLKPAFDNAISQARTDEERKCVTEKFNQSIEDSIGSFRKSSVNPLEQTAEKDELHGLFVLYTRNGPVTVDEVLSNPEKFNGEDINDPVEPEYNNYSFCAKIYACNSHYPAVHSFAHGANAKYRLLPSADAVFGPPKTAPYTPPMTAPYTPPMTAPYTPPSPAAIGDEAVLAAIGPAAWAARFVAEASGSHVDYAVGAILTAAGAAAGARTSIRPHVDSSFHQPPILRVVCLGGPSSGKSQPIARVMKALAPIEREEQASWAEAARARRAAETAVKLPKGSKAEAITRAVPVAADEAPPPLMFSAVARISMDEKTGELKYPGMPDLIVNDSTLESLVEKMMNREQGIIQHCDELRSVLLGSGQYKGGNDATVISFYCTSYDGGDYKATRVHRGRVHAPVCALSMIGALTPSDLSGLTRRANGFIERFLWTWPSSKLMPAPLYISKTLSQDTARLEGMFRRIRTADGVQLTFDQDACTVFENFRHENHKTMQAAETEGSMFLAGALGKFDGMLLRIACVLHLLDWANAPGIAALVSTVGRHVVERAITLLRWFEGALRRVVGDSCITEQRADSQTIQNFVKAKGLWSGFKLRDLQRGCWGLKARTREELSTILSGMVADGVLTEQTGRSSTYALTGL
jgi:hypothetical protein